MTGASLAAHLASFAAALRKRNVPVVLSDETDALSALTLVDLVDRPQVRRARAVALKIRRRDRPVFDELFERYWRASAGESAIAEAARTRSVPHAATPRRPGASGRRSIEGESSREVPLGDTPAYSPAAPCAEELRGVHGRRACRWSALTRLRKSLRETRPPPGFGARAERHGSQAQLPRGRSRPAGSSRVARRARRRGVAPGRALRHERPMDAPPGFPGVSPGVEEDRAANRDFFSTRR